MDTVGGPRGASSACVTVLAGDGRFGQGGDVLLLAAMSRVWGDLAGVRQPLGLPVDLSRFAAPAARWSLNRVLAFVEGPIPREDVGHAIEEVSERAAGAGSADGRGG